MEREKASGRRTVWRQKGRPIFGCKTLKGHYALKRTSKRKPGAARFEKNLEDAVLLVKDRGKGKETQNRTESSTLLSYQLRDRRLGDLFRASQRARRKRPGPRTGGIRVPLLERGGVRGGGGRKIIICSVPVSSEPMRNHRQSEGVGGPPSRID